MAQRWLGTKGTNTLQLRIMRYEFPGRRRPNVYDSNWLTVEGRVDTGEWIHEFQDPCLLTWEAEELLGWLRSLPTPPTARLSFTERLLEFEYNSDDPWSPALILQGEALPDGVYSADERWVEGVRFVLFTDENNRDAFCDEFERSVSAYPRR